MYPQALCLCSNSCMNPRRNVKKLASSRVQFMHRTPACKSSLKPWGLSVVDKTLYPAATASAAIVVLLLSLCLSSVDAAVETVYNSRTSDRDLADRKVMCYRDIDNGLRGEACEASAIDKENCALACVSPSCYDSVYGADPLEEGEIDLRRGRQFKACIRGQSRAERIAKVRGASSQ